MILLPPRSTLFPYTTLVRSEVGVRGAHGVAVDAAGADAPTPAPFDGVVERHHHGAVRGEGVEKKPEQDASTGSRAPRGTAEHAVIVDEAALTRAAHDPQHAGHGAPTWS